VDTQPTSFPNSSKYQEPAVLNAAQMLAHRKRTVNLPDAPPASVIFCYQSSLAQYLVRHHPVKRIHGFFGDLLLIKSTHGQVAVAANFGIGAPVVAVLVEELAAWGVQRFLSIGLAGGLQPDLRSGDVVVCDRAIRAEGTSHHYLPPSRFAQASPQMVEHLTGDLSALRVAHTIGASWTTDVPYRETLHEVKAWQLEGIKTVEMEAAALFAIGQYLERQVGAAFVVGDTLADLRWRLETDDRCIQHSLRSLLDAAIACLKVWR
jgi:uridine phosphorylase